MAVEAREEAVVAIVRVHGEASRRRAEEGVACAAALWREKDGDAAAFVDFCAEAFVPEGPGLDALFERFSENLEEIQGSGLRVSKRLQWPLHVDSGALLPVDETLAAWNPLAHLLDDWFENRLAFTIRLNFPRRGLAEKLREGRGWTRRRWAMARLGEFAGDRVPAQVQLALGAAQARAESYIAGYNIHTGCLMSGGSRAFEEERRLLMHWNLRDEIKSQYGEAGGTARQRLLLGVMERVVDGSIPACAIDGRGIAWDPLPNTVGGASASAEGPRRYALMLGLFHAMRDLDAASPDAPTLVARSFDSGREIPVDRAEALLESLFRGEAFARAAASVRACLGRPLEAFDIWFRGFGEAARPDEASLDARTRALFPDAAAFERAIPSVLRALGFEPQEADWLAARIEVDAARGSGHAMPAAMRSDKARLRTRVSAQGMDYKGFNIAMHELGHNVEQVYSLHGIDEYLLAGVPNNAFTEAFAFVFQARDLEVLVALELGGGPDPATTPSGVAPKGDATLKARDARVLADYWQTCEIAGVALVDIAVWRWLYDHPDATPDSLRDAVLALARGTWNRLFAPAMGLRDSAILAVYSHMVEYPLYLPDYPLGHLVAFQIEAFLEGKVLGREMGRMCRLGKLTPDEWMRQALGGELSAAPLVAAAEAALERRA